jgi:hypothetical protein
MKEILTCSIWTGLKIKVIIDRETGEFVLYHSRFRLNIQAPKASLVECDSGFTVCNGYLSGDNWRFEEQDLLREAEDPFVAAIQILYDILQY